MGLAKPVIKLDAGMQEVQCRHGVRWDDLGVELDMVTVRLKHIPIDVEYRGTCPTCGTTYVSRANFRI